MNLSDRIKRWWNPAEWRDEHPEVTEGGAGHPLSEEERAEDQLSDTHEWRGGGTVRPVLPQGDDAERR